jgi:hypothetical protein
MNAIIRRLQIINRQLIAFISIIVTVQVSSLPSSKPSNNSSFSLNCYNKSIDIFVCRLI